MMGITGTAVGVVRITRSVLTVARSAMNIMGSEGWCTPPRWTPVRLQGFREGAEGVYRTRAFAFAISLDSPWQATCGVLLKQHPRTCRFVADMAGGIYLTYNKLSTVAGGRGTIISAAFGEWFAMWTAFAGLSRPLLRKYEHCK